MCDNCLSYRYVLNANVSKYFPRLDYGTNAKTVTVFEWLHDILSLSHIQLISGCTFSITSERKTLYDYAESNCSNIYSNFSLFTHLKRCLWVAAHSLPSLISLFITFCSSFDGISEKILVYLCGNWKLLIFCDKTIILAIASVKKMSSKKTLDSVSISSIEL